MTQNIFKEGDRVMNVFTGVTGTVLGYKIYEDHSIIYVVHLDSDTTVYYSPSAIALIQE